jgi:hypothetical protein
LAHKLYGRTCRALAILSAPKKSCTHVVSQSIQSTETISFSTALTAFLLYYSILFAFPNYLLNDPDTLWHIRVGQWILDHAQFPTVDVFSYTATGKPWIYPEWLSEVFFAVAFKFGGWHAVVVLAAVACSALIGILCFYLVRHLRFSVAIGWTALTALAISPHFFARPHVFSYVILAIWMINLLDAYDADDFDLSSLFTLAPMMTLWANLHGSFTLGLVLFYVFVGYCLWQNIVRRNYTRCWRLLILMLAVTLCASITPYGISPALLTKEQLDLRFTSTHIEEFQSPDFQTYKFHLVLLVALLVAITGLGIRLRGPRLITFGIITLMGLSYARGLVLFFFLAPIILARPASTCVPWLAPQLSENQTSDNDRALDPVLRFLEKRSILIAAGSMAVAALITVSTWWRTDVSPPAAIAPKGAIEFVRRTNIGGNVFNEYDFGGYLIFSGVPTFVDGRALLFGDAFLHRYFDAVSLTDINDAFALLDEYKVTWAILHPNEPLALALARSALWDEAYSDKFSVVLVRRR